jgi:sodium/proline symporter
VTVLALLLIAALLVARWGARRARASDDYFVAGRRAGAWLVGIAGTAAGISAFTFVGGPGLFAVAGIGSLWIVLSAPLTGALQCWAVGEPVAVISASHRVLTLPELLEVRLGGRTVRGVAAAVVVVGCVASLAVQAQAAAVLGETLLRVPGALAAAVIMAGTAAYTAAGGMRAGLVADAAQGAVMAVVALTVAAAALAVTGGPGPAADALRNARPELLGSFGTTPPATAWAWWALFCLGTCAQPHYVQKFFFLRSPAQLRALPGILTAALAVTLTVWLGVGLAGTALAARGTLTPSRPDDLAPLVVERLGGWAVILVGVAVLAALMSTSASFLNLAAAAVTRDLPAAWGRAPLGLGTARAATVVAAAASTAVALASDRAVALLGVAGWGFFTAALLPVMTVGLVWRRASSSAAVAAMASGALVDLALEVVRGSLPPGLEPGLAGAAVGTLLLVMLSRRGP